jgi:hypothetical protein
MEFKYRFAQAVVFGLPVVALHYFGSSLGGSPTESRRWVGILQSLLAGWVVYVGAAGMLFEGLLLLRYRFTGNLLIALIAILMYLFSLISVLGIFFTGEPLYTPLLFHLAVVLLASWSGWNWRRLKMRQ